MFNYQCTACGLTELAESDPLYCRKRDCRGAMIMPARNTQQLLRAADRMHDHECFTPRCSSFAYGGYCVEHTRQLRR